MDQTTLINRIEIWTQSFAETLSQWEEWIERTQTAFLRADYQQLQELQATGESTLRLVKDRYSERRVILDLAEEMGIRCRNLHELTKTFWGEAGIKLTERLKASATRMRRLQQASLAVWITAFESSVHSAQFLQILSTGESDSATYSPSEGESLGGGRLVNQAA